MLKTEQIRTFIGANSVRGYGSLRDSLYDPRKTDTVLLIKGGAGNGKSTLMSRMALSAEDRGYSVERVYCPSDPKSLDGIVCAELGFAMTDATPPHVWEPGAHCLPERYISLSPYVSEDVSEKKEEILKLCKELKAARQEADKCISAAFETDSELTGEILTYADTGKLAAVGLGIAKKYLPRKAGEKPGEPKMLRRFISAISPREQANFYSTPYALCGKDAITVVLDDGFGLAPFVLGAVADEAQKRGLTIWGFFDPLVTTRLLGLCIPGIRLCILPSAAAQNAAEIVNTAECITASDREKLGSRPEVLTSVKAALINEAHARLGVCLDIHDEIEAEYRPYTDFAGLNDLASELEEKYINGK